MTVTVEGSEGSKPMRARNFAESLRFAAAGIAYAFRTQRNVRAHAALGGLAWLLGLHLSLSRAEMAVLLLTIGFVIAMELVNTAVESVVDLVSEGYHRLAEQAKNVAAGAVLAAAITAVGVGYALFFERLRSGQVVLPDGAPRLPLAAIAIGFALAGAAALVLKALRPNFRLRGGMPSIHAAIAGSLATALYFMAQEPGVAVVAFLLAALVGQSRVEAGIHTVWEVLAGGALGMLVMTGALWVFAR